MKRTIILVLAACFILFGVSCIKTQPAGDISASETSAVCLCEQGKAGATVWCHKCSTGYVGGEKIKCPEQFKTKAGGAVTSPCQHGDKKDKNL